MVGNWSLEARYLIPYWYICGKMEVCLLCKWRRNMILPLWEILWMMLGDDLGGGRLSAVQETAYRECHVILIPSGKVRTVSAPWWYTVILERSDANYSDWWVLFQWRWRRGRVIPDVTTCSERSDLIPLMKRKLTFWKYDCLMEALRDLERDDILFYSGDDTIPFCWYSLHSYHSDCDDDTILERRTERSIHCVPGTAACGIYWLCWWYTDTIAWKYKCGIRYVDICSSVFDTYYSSAVVAGTWWCSCLLPDDDWWGSLFWYGESTDMTVMPYDTFFVSVFCCVGIVFCHIPTIDDRYVTVVGGDDGGDALRVFPPFAVPAPAGDTMRCSACRRATMLMPVTAAGMIPFGWYRYSRSCQITACRWLPITTGDCLWWRCRYCSIPPTYLLNAVISAAVCVFYLLPCSVENYLPLCDSCSLFLLLP